MCVCWHVSDALVACMHACMHVCVCVCLCVYVHSEWCLGIRVQLTIKQTMQRSGAWCVNYYEEVCAYSYTLSSLWCLGTRVQFTNWKTCKVVCACLYTLSSEWCLGETVHLTIKQTMQRSGTWCVNYYEEVCAYSYTLSSLWCLGTRVQFTNWRTCKDVCACLYTLSSEWCLGETVQLTVKQTMQRYGAWCVNHSANACAYFFVRREPQDEKGARSACTPRTKTFTRMTAHRLTQTHILTPTHTYTHRGQEEAAGRGKSSCKLWARPYRWRGGKLCDARLVQSLLSQQTT